MSTPIKIFKTLKKKIVIEGNELELSIEYSNHSSAPYHAILQTPDGSIFCRKWTRELSQVPSMLVDLREEVASELKEKNSVNNNIDELKKYLDEF